MAKDKKHNPGKNTPVSYYDTDPLEMMRQLGKRPTDEQLKKYEEQEKDCENKKDRKKKGGKD